jgi:hypothetical protein
LRKLISSPKPNPSPCGVRLKAARPNNDLVLKPTVIGDREVLSSTIVKNSMGGCFCFINNKQYDVACWQLPFAGADSSLELVEQHIGLLLSTLRLRQACSAKLWPKRFGV